MIHRGGAENAERNTHEAPMDSPRGTSVPSRLNGATLRCLFFVVFVIFVVKNCPAQDAPPPVAPPKPAWNWDVTIRNRTGYKLDQPRVFQLSRTIVDVKGVRKLGGDWTLTLEARASADPVNRLGYPRGLWVEPRQAFVAGTVKRVALKLGLQQVVWGQADGLRVLDVINPLDYREFLLDEFLDSRRPLWTVRADVPIKSGTLQALWIPYFAPGRLPAATDEFGLGDSFGIGLFTRQAGAVGPIQTRTLPTRRPGYRLNASQVGLRWSQSLGTWDVTVNAFHGWEDIPTPYLTGVEAVPTPGGPIPRVTFAPRFDRKTVVGGTATTNFGPVVLRLEAGWNFNRSQFVRTAPNEFGFRKHGQFSSVVGLDYSPRQWVWLSGQYFLQASAAPNLPVPRTNHLASFTARTNFFRETLKPELFVLTGLNRAQYLIRPKLVRSFGDHWSVGVGADFFGGDRTTFFGAFTDRGRAVVEVKWTK